MKTWKTIEGFDRYEASTDGEIRNKKTDRVLKSHAGPYGYHRLTIVDNNGITKSFTVHRLIALTFIPNINNKPQLDHIDNNPGNNRSDNLQWFTNSENQLKSYEEGRRVSKYGKTGYEVIGCKDNSIVKFKNSAEAARYVGCNPDGVIKVVLGYNKSIYGWTFKKAKVD